MTPVSPLEAAEVVRSAAAEHAEETEHGRQVATAVIEAYQASRLAGLMSPVALGGAAAHPAVAVEVIGAISESDASAGWCAGIGMGSNYLSALIPEATARDLFTDIAKGGAGPFAPGAMAVPNGAGVHIAGRWSFASNCQERGVMAAGVILCDDRGPRVGPGGIELGLAFLRGDDYTVIENWDMAGLRGTGSHDVVAELDLSEDRVSTLWADKWPSEPLFRLRSFDVLGPCLAVVPLAIGRVALRLLREKTTTEAAGEPKPGPRPRVSDDPVAQVKVAEAEIHLRSTQAMLLDLLDRAMDNAALGNPPSRETSALIGLTCGECLRAGKHAVDTATELMGTAAQREGSPMLKLRRDVSAAGGHVMFSHGLQIGLGRELAGIPTAAFPFLPGAE